MQQGTSQWLMWRRAGLGASDAPVIMGIYTYKTPFQLWEEKLGRECQEKKNQFILDKGHTIEKRARLLYEILNDKPMPPALVEYAKMPFLRASLDGYDAEKNIILEIKYVGKKELQEIRDSGKIPERYYPQVQHQLLVTGAKCVDFFAYNDELDSYTLVKCEPDNDYIHLLVEKEREFWQLVQKQTAPELTEKDYVFIQDQEAQFLIDQWIFKKKLLDKIAEEEQALKKQILEKIKEPRVKFGLVKISRQKRAGNIDYKIIPELQNLDLEKYRKPEIVYWRFDLEKKAE